ncbi:MAG: EF-P lysine aminoacylase EpmA [Deltaproteobacteria bacterium]
MVLRTNILYLRAAIIQSIRSYFISRDFLEVETPLRIPANAPEEHIEPIMSDDQYLQTSPELCMKRLLCRGYGKIFQISRCWRNNERGRNHVPEFTMLEWYRADSDYRDIMNDCEDLLAWVSEKSIVADLPLKTSLTGKIQLITVQNAFAQFASKDMHAAVSDGSFDELMVTMVEPGLANISPVILFDYPARMASLARIKDEDQLIAERFELYAGGLELANGFSELNDPDEQRSRFEMSNSHRMAKGYPPLPLPEPFLKELSSMPRSAGIALGVDRLVMLCTGATMIDDVLAFTPEDL